MYSENEFTSLTTKRLGMRLISFCIGAEKKISKDFICGLVALEISIFAHTLLSFGLFKHDPIMFIDQYKIIKILFYTKIIMTI